MKLHLFSLGAGVLVGVIYHLMRAWSNNAPASDLRSFWGALGCACWAV
jgi:xanthosine utilization system XapX-like protein